MSLSELALREDLTGEFGIFSIGGLYYLKDSKDNLGNGLGSPWFARKIDHLKPN
jgi:hypothetical protein